MRLCICSVLAAAMPASAAESYPSRPVRFVVPYAPGGGSDIIARLIGQKLGERLGANFVIDNRPGAASMLGTEIVAKAPADGYTIILADAPHAMNTATYRNVNYDAVIDFTPIMLVASCAEIFAAHPSFPANTLKELLATPKDQTAKLAMGTSGQGSTGHLTYELLHMRTGLLLNHVPYKGGGPAIVDLVAGQIPLVLNAIPPFVPHLQAKRVKGLALSSAKRHPTFAAIPTFEESGVRDFVVTAWYGVLAPAGTPRNVTEILRKEIARALEQPDVLQRFATLALDVEGRGPDEFRTLIANDVKRWKETAAKANIRFD
jgi:tripartite-type tricarboxylate transporter receptor subunit TctC